MFCTLLDCVRLGRLRPRDGVRRGSEYYRESMFANNGVINFSSPEGPGLLFSSFPGTPFLLASSD